MLMFKTFDKFIVSGSVHLEAWIKEVKPQKINASPAFENLLLTKQFTRDLVF